MRNILGASRQMLIGRRARIAFEDSRSRKTLRNHAVVSISAHCAAFVWRRRLPLSKIERCPKRSPLFREIVGPVNPRKPDCCQK